MYNIMIAEGLVIFLLSIIIFVIMKEKKPKNLDEKWLTSVTNEYVQYLSYHGTLHHCSDVSICQKNEDNRKLTLVEFCLYNDEGTIEFHRITICNKFIYGLCENHPLTIDVFSNFGKIDNYFTSEKFEHFVGNKKDKNSFYCKLSKMYFEEEIYVAEFEKKESFSNATIIQNNARKEKILKNFDSHLKEIITISNDIQDIDIIVSSSELVEILGLSRDNILNITEANLDISELIFNNIEGILEDLKKFKYLLNKGSLSNDEELNLQKSIDEKIKIIENNL